MKNFIFPSFYKHLFKDFDLIEDLDFKKRKVKLNIYKKETKSKDKFFNFFK